MSLVTNIGINVSAALSGTSGLAPVSAVASFVKALALSSGTGANQGDAVLTRDTTIASAGSLSLDLKGSLTDAVGTAFTPAKLKFILIYAPPANTTDLTLFGDAAHVPILSDVTVTTVLKPGGMFVLFAPASAGIAVTATTGDIIKITNGSGATAAVQIVLVGTSA